MYISLESFLSPCPHISPVFIVRHVGSDDPEMVITDPEYYMICMITYKTEHEQRRTGFFIRV